MKEQETYAAIQKLAEQFVESKGYTSETFKDIDFGNDLEEEVCEYLDSIKDTLINWEDYKSEYENAVYEEVLDLLNIPEVY